MEIQQKSSPCVASWIPGWIELVLCEDIMVNAPGDVTQSRSVPATDVSY